MASQLLPKLTRYIPLWQRTIPNYPVYWKGNPQLRVYLPLFWMKMTKWPQLTASDTVTFEVHPQMTKLDVKNYLEKIYNVSVLSVKCHLTRGKDRHHPKYGYTIQPEADKRIAFVQLAPEHAIKFPEIFKEKATEEEKAVKEQKKMVLDSEKLRRKEWDRIDMPVWFR